MELGNELKRDACPPKNYRGNLFVELIPVLIALVIMALFSGNLFLASGMELAMVAVIEIVVMFLLYGCAFIMFRGMKKRMAQTYISVCENGVRGICPLNGYKNREFSLSCKEITNIQVKGDRLFLYAPAGNVVLVLQDAMQTAALIQSRMNPS